MEGRVDPRIGFRIVFLISVLHVWDPVGRYRLILRNVYIIKSPACDPTTPKGPRPSVLLKLHPIYFGFVYFGSQTNFKKRKNMLGGVGWGWGRVGGVRAVGWDWGRGTCGP